MRLTGVDKQDRLLKADTAKLDCSISVDSARGMSGLPWSVLCAVHDSEWLINLCLRKIARMNASLLFKTH